MRSEQSSYLYLLLNAPGKVVTLVSPYAPDEVMRRLRAGGVQITASKRASLHLPQGGNERRFVMWVEPDGTGARIFGQMQTPLRPALLRLAASLLIGVAGIYLMLYARIWMGLIFLAFAVGYLLLSQYQRVVGRDLRRHVDWLRKTLDAR